MATSQEVAAKARETVEATGQALDAQSTTFYRNLDHTVRQLEALTREAFQAKLMDEYKSILNKLENGQSLSGEEQRMLKLLIVGEAKYYLKHENDLENWRDELQRLADEIGQVASSGLDDVDSLLHMQALCRDARGVLPNITFYYREKERLARFEQAASGDLDAEAGKILADVIRGMLSSSQM